MRTRMLIAAALFFIVSIVVATPAISAERVVTFREALAQSMDANPEVRAFGQGLLAKKADIGIARSFLLPTLTFEERFMRTNNPTYAFMAKLNQERFNEEDFAVRTLNNPSALNDFQTSFSFVQPVFAPEAYIGLDMARREFAARKNEFIRKKEEVARTVVRMYLGVQTAKAFVLAAEKGVADATEHERIAKVRHNVEIGLYSDMLRAQVALSTAEERLISAQKHLAVAKRALGLLLGLDESIDVKKETLQFSVRDIDYYYQAARSRNDVKAGEDIYRNAENSLKMASARYLPIVGVGGTYQLNHHSRPFGEDGDSWQLVAFLKWELFDGMKREHERVKARHQIAEAEEHLSGLKKKTLFQVYEAYLGVEESEKSLELARAALKAADEGRRLVKVRYENELSTMVDLLDAQMSLDSSRANVILKENSFAMSIVELGFQSGTILSDLEMVE